VVEQLDLPVQKEPSKPVEKTNIKSTTPKFVRGQKVFLKNENMKPYIVKKQDPVKPNKWHIQSIYGNGFANDLKVVDEKDMFTNF